MAVILVTKKELDQLKQKREVIGKKLNEAKQRLGVMSKGSWGGSAGKDLAQQDVYLFSSFIKQYDELINQCRVSPKPFDQDKIHVGSKVRLRIRGEEYVYVIGIMPLSDDDVGLISPTSPLGQKLIGKLKGDCVSFETPQGASQARVIEILEP